MIPPFELLKTGFFSVVVVVVVVVFVAVVLGVAPGKGVFLLFAPVLFMNFGLFTEPWEVVLFLLKVLVLDFLFICLFVCLIVCLFI